MNTKKKIAPKQPKIKRATLHVDSEDLEKAIASLGTFKTGSPDDTVCMILTALKNGSKIKVVNDISVELRKYDGLKLECDGLTRVLSYVLNQHKVKHKIMIGVLYHKGNKVVPIHWWIILADGRTVDYRARMWAGDVATVPHGVFRQEAFSDVQYVGNHNEIEVTKKVFDALTLVTPEPKLIKEEPKPEAAATA